MKIIRISKCGECPWFSHCEVTGMFKGKLPDLDAIHPECPLEDAELK